MNYFTKVLLENNKKPIFKSDEKCSTIETLDTILKYKINNNFCFLEKYRKLDGSFLTSLVYRIPDSVCNPLLGQMYAKDKLDRTFSAVLSSPVFQEQVLPCTFIDQELHSNFTYPHKIKTHLSMVADRIRPICQSDESLFFQTIIASYLDPALLKREESAVIANGYYRSHDFYRDKQHSAITMKEATVFAKVLSEEKVTIQNKTFTVLKVRTPFSGNAEIVLSKNDMPYSNLVDLFAEFHIIEATASFLPIEMENRCLSYNFDDALYLLSRWFKEDDDFDNIEELFDDSVVVYNDIIKVASKKETAKQFLKLKKNKYKESLSPIYSALSTAKRFIMNEIDTGYYISKLNENPNFKKYYQVWKAILKVNSDDALNSKIKTLDIKDFEKLLNKNGIIFFEYQSHMNIIIEDSLFITMNANNRIKEIYFLNIPVLENSFFEHEYIRHFNSIPFSIPRSCTYMKLNTTSNYKDIINDLEAMITRVTENMPFRNLFPDARILIHSLFENLKTWIVNDGFEDEIYRLRNKIRIPRFMFTDEDIPSLPIFMEAFFEVCYTLGQISANSCERFYSYSAQTILERIKSMTRNSLGKNTIPFEFDEKANAAYTALLHHYPEQETSEDETSENLAYLLFIQAFVETFIDKGTYELNKIT